MKGETFAFMVLRPVNSGDGVLVPIPIHALSADNDVPVMNTPHPIIYLGASWEGDVIHEEAECHGEDSCSDYDEAVEWNDGDGSQDESQDSVSTGFGASTVATEASIADNDVGLEKMLKCNGGCDAAMAAEDHDTYTFGAQCKAENACNLDCLLSELLDELCRDVANLGRRGDVVFGSPREQLSSVIFIQHGTLVVQAACSLLWRARGHVQVLKWLLLNWAQQPTVA
jgi:hypothetical protein